MQTTGYEKSELQTPHTEIAEREAMPQTAKEDPGVDIADVLYGRTLPKPNAVYCFVKRAFDIFFSFVGLILLSPVFLIVAILIKIEDPSGKVFFRQPRFGLHRTHFMMYKFRSMFNNAEELLEHLSPEQKKEWERNFKLENDPRITKTGEFLRKSSLDEIPQLLNILKGDMSIVGPRPPLIAEEETYGDALVDVMSVRPGLTGYWQAYGRSGVAFDERIRMNLYYISHMSVMMDIKIIARTVISVLKREGAI